MRDHAEGTKAPTTFGFEVEMKAGRLVPVIKRRDADGLTIARLELRDAAEAALLARLLGVVILPFLRAAEAGEAPGRAAQDMGPEAQAGRGPA